MSQDSSVGRSTLSTIRRCSVPVLLAFTAVSAGCVSPMKSSECEPNPPQKLLWAINEVRAEHGLPALLVSRRLMVAAEGHAEAVAEGIVFAHVGADGLGPGSRIRQTGYRYLEYGENIAKNMTSPQAIVRAWMASKDHRAVLLGARYREIGIGFKTFGLQNAWVADLGLREMKREFTRCHPRRSGG
jgi:uncharacterized protein YkwD